MYWSYIYIKTYYKPFWTNFILQLGIIFSHSLFIFFFEYYQCHNYFSITCAISFFFTLHHFIIFLHHTILLFFCITPCHHFLSHCTCHFFHIAPCHYFFTIHNVIICLHYTMLSFFFQTTQFHHFLHYTMSSLFSYNTIYVMSSFFRITPYVFSSHSLNHHLIVKLAPFFLSHCFFGCHWFWFQCCRLNVA
jgi:hypothetical protein